MESIFEFGRHKGHTFSEVQTSDRSYCDWALRQPSPTGQLKEFCDFLRGESTGTSIGLTPQQRARVQQNREAATARKAARLSSTTCEGSAPPPDPKMPVRSSCASAQAPSPAFAQAPSPASAQASGPSSAQPPKITLIKDLQLTGRDARNWTLAVKVTRKDSQLRATKAGGEWFSATLRDKSGEVRAAFFQAAASAAFRGLRVGGVFRISGGLVKTSPSGGLELTFSYVELKERGLEDLEGLEAEGSEDPHAWDVTSLAKILDGDLDCGCMVNVRGVVVEEREAETLNISGRLAKKRKVTVLGEDGEKAAVDFWGEAAAASYKNQEEVLFLKGMKVRSYSFSHRFTEEEEKRYALSSVASTLICRLHKTQDAATAELHAQLSECIREDHRQQSERKRQREEFAAARAAARERADLERERLEALREQGLLKCKACNRKLIDWTATADWGSREYHKACWRRLVDD